MVHTRLSQPIGDLRVTSNIAVRLASGRDLVGVDAEIVIFE